jgi:hypothetical protein
VSAAAAPLTAEQVSNTIAAVPNRLAQDVVAQLAYREKNHPGKDCWLADAAKGRYLLVVPVNDPLSYIAVRRYSGQTLAGLYGAGLIDYGPDIAEVPAFVPFLTGDTRVGGIVRLTDAGRRLAAEAVTG